MNPNKSLIRCKASDMIAIELAILPPTISIAINTITIIIVKVRIL